MKLISLHKNYDRLIAKAKKGNRKAQHEVFQLFSPKMMSVCRQYVKNNALAEEVMLSGFLKVFTKLDSYEGTGSFEGWIRRIMVNESISELRKQKKLFFQDESVIENSLGHATEFPSELEVEDIQKLIDALPDGYKTVFVLYAVEGYKHSEIAELLHISEGTSKSQLSKARKMLQQLVTKQNNSSYGTQ
ncbi:RNA polymerase sigma factor [Marinirhabdus gelatinilytica]|uniref:RNA polymerase sigma-70 factor (ECF subfamily) n=1 Tax=Marinirhabdus gelatinilytica TaxID=1703343 RepID=A0A370Q7A4_9FLAO|nr:RNA polymerase sigma factor [Marinirhabdus gelatinilytica]RDK84234.1 RNA polymerase sigma-70 factor (ECF subfamily) [Marinirhabdus gelatinilytica]